MIKYKNIYYMLAYAFSFIEESRYEKVLTEKFDDAADLLATILCKGTLKQIKPANKKSRLN